MQVNHITARGEDTLCIALMNECDRELKDVHVRLAIPSGTFRARLWRDNQPQKEAVEVINGQVKVSLSPKGITTLVIEGVKLPTTFQQKFQTQPRPASKHTHITLKTSAGEARAMIVSFGNDLTWLYAYLTADEKQVRAASLKVRLPDGEEVLEDNSFPFESALPLPSHAESADLVFELRLPDGTWRKRQRPSSTHVDQMARFDSLSNRTPA